jgi:uncharacterized membrane protein
VFVLLVVVLVIGLGAVAMAAATAGRVPRGERRVRMAAVLAIVGALVLGFGVILFFAANWSDISRWLRLALLMAGMTLLYGLGFYLREVRRENLHVGDTFFFLGTILFGASIFLVGQMYHVQAHDPLGFLIWAIGCLLVGLVTRSGPIAALAILVFLAWVVHELIDLSTTAEDTAILLPVLLALYGVALYSFGTGAARWLEPLRFERPMRLVGYPLVALGVFVFTFRLVHENAIFKDALDLTRAKVLLWGFAAAAFAGCIALVVLRFRSRRSSIPEAAVLAAAALLVLLAVLAPETSSSSLFDDGGGSATTYPLVFNALLALIALGAIVVGFYNDEVWLANAGVAWAGIDIIARFFDPQWSMLERSLVFMPVGALVIAGGYMLERRRSSAEARA